MSGSKEIRNKIKSVQNTRKITKAMEMVAASKMKKAQDRMRASRPYLERMLYIASHVAQANTEYRHPFLVKRDTVKRVVAVVITTDKGLCGGLNTNILRMVLNQHKKWIAEGKEVQYVAIGNKGAGFLGRMGATVISTVTHLGDVPHIERLVGPLKPVFDGYSDGTIDEVYLFSTGFVNTMK
ncbi:MAG: F0F1 ATP synthase subunit gamma, partial [Burkholderiales bacterium]|nr:F0F1 ATP synthase subunit gamma [Burkholderiales bacterium]